MKHFLILFLLFGTISAQIYKPGEARGAFFALGVGPKYPLSDFTVDSNIGIGFTSEFSYTDNKLFPMFIYGYLSYMHFPGSQEYYKTSKYSAFSTNMVTLQSGLRFYLSPIFENIVLLMPILEAGFSFAYFEKLHQFKSDFPDEDFLEANTKFGGHIGFGVSMFLLDVLGQYNYFYRNQFLSVELKIRIPLYIIF